MPERDAGSGNDVAESDRNDPGIRRQTRRQSTGNGRQSGTHQFQDVSSGRIRVPSHRKPKMRTRCGLRRASLQQCQQPARANFRFPAPSTARMAPPHGTKSASSQSRTACWQRVVGAGPGKRFPAAACVCLAAIERERNEISLDRSSRKAVSPQRLRHFVYEVNVYFRRCGKADGFP